MKQDFTTRIAALFCAFLMIVPDVSRAAQAKTAYSNHQLDYSEQQEENARNARYLVQASKNPEDDKSFSAIKNELAGREVVKIAQNGTLKHAPGTTAIVGMPASTAYGVIGRSQLDPMGNPHDDVFDVEINPETVTGKPYAYLSYKLRGLQSGHGIAKSINNNATLGTLDFTPANHWVEATEPLQLEHLQLGTNHVRFSMPHRLDLPVEIKDVTIVFSAQPLDADAAPELPGTLCTATHPFAVWPTEAQAQKRALSDLEVPSIPGNIINVTRGAYAYGLQQENGTQRLGIGIDRQRIPVGMDVNDVQTYYFDYTAKRWTAIATDSLYSSPNPELQADPEAAPTAPTAEGTPGEGDVNFVPSQGATQYFNGLIKTPEMPEAAAFTPTTIQDIKAANPAEGMNIMQPPGIDKSGDAIINYPLAITPGRNGMTPQLALSYNSSQGTGWMGVGWNISTPKITVDTRWGVPEFNEEKETEVYTLNGSGLRMEGKYRANRPQDQGGTMVAEHVDRQTGAVRFFEKTMTSYQEIERHGTSPASYYWVVTTADQTKYYYGNYDSNQLNATLKDASGNIAEWYLMRIEDKWGNCISYAYEEVTGNTGNEMLSGGKAIVPLSITYTGHGTTFGKYSVHFERAANPRADATVSLRYGFKVVDQEQLIKVVAKYDNVEYRNFEFDYGAPGAFGKTLLRSVTENRHGQEFYKHEFGYKGIEHAYSDPKELIIAINNFTYTDAIAGEFIPYSTKFEKSPLNSSWSLGLSGGVYLGVGFQDAKWDKGLTAGVKYMRHQNWTKGKNQLIDVNGDGLIDILTRDDNNLKYHRMEQLPNNDYVLEPNQSISGATEFSKVKSFSNQWTFEASPPFSFIGSNLMSGKSESTYYLSDVNADGIPDIVEDQKVRFGHRYANGSIGYEDSSEDTPNPVMMGAKPLQNTAMSGPETQAFEMVRQWRAPINGRIDITGDAILPQTASLDGVAISIQKNSQFIKGVTTLAPGATETINILNTYVTAGDVILFRAFANTIGIGDELTWEPQITYNNKTRIDANDIPYTQVSSADGMLLSAPSPVGMSAEGTLKISWDPLTIPQLTDQVEFTIAVREIDDNGNQVGNITYHRALFAANTMATFTPAAMVDDQGNTAGFFTGFSSVSGNSKHQLEFQFSINATSNVAWKAINWRPVIEWDQDGVSPIQKSYPVVNYVTYNHPVRLNNASASASLFSSTHMIFYPTFAPGFAQQLSSSAKAHFVVKTKNKHLCELELNVDPNGTITYIDPGSQTSIVVGSYQDFLVINQTDIVANKLFFELTTADEELASILDQAVISTYQAFLPVGNDPGIAQFDGTHGNFNIWLHKANDIAGNNYLGFGQFAWSGNHVNPINISSIAFPTFTTAQLDLSSNDITIIQNNLAALNNIEAWPLVPQRQEFVEKLTPVPVSFQTDRWAHSDVNLQVNATGMRPGNAGEIEEPDGFVAAPATNPGLYSGRAPTKLTWSKSLAFSGGVNVQIASPTWSLIGSHTIIPNESNKRGSYSLRDFIDLNGDRYPDVMESEEPDAFTRLTIRPTNPYGGLRFQDIHINQSNAYISASWNESTGLVAGGTFTNDKETIKVSADGSYTNDDVYTKTAWVDLNGDGLSDFVSTFGTVNTVKLNTGWGLDDNTITSNTFTELLPKYNANTFPISGTKAIEWKNLSYSAGVSLSATWQNAARIYADFNGDGLTDYVVADGSSQTIFLNTGTSFISSTLNFPVSHAQESRSTGGGVNGSFSIGLTPQVSPVKVVTTITANASLSMSSGRQVLMDMNGDGFVDIVESEVSGLNYKLKVRYNQLNQVNLLQTVTNPIGGSFDLAYEASGNRYGAYDPIIQNPTLSQPNNEKLLWDMAQQKQVLASVTVHDNLDINQNGLDDGEDSYTTTFRYDGGIYSRREREFLGFTRIETRSPERFPSQFQNMDQGTVLLHTSSIVDFVKPVGNAFVDRVNYEYISGVQLATFDYNRVFAVFPDTITGYGTISKTFKRLTKVSYNTYDLFPVGQTAGQSTFNRVQLSNVIDPNNLNLGESDCIFPALSQTETFVFLDPFDDTDSLRHYSYKYDLTYDEFFNVIRVIEQSKGEATTATWGPNGYVDADPNPIPVQILNFDPIYLGQLIAEMDYFDPINAADQTNVLQEHRIYETSTIDANMRRKATVDQLNAPDNLAPATISQWLGLNASTKHTSQIAYNTNGTVSSVTGPANDNGEQYSVNYTYDAANSQYVEQVANVYGDQSCMGYNYATGMPTHTIDPNRFVTYFEFDDADRIKRVYAPREYADANAPYTIAFDYYPQGHGQSTVPVAVTRHYTGETAKALPVTNCTLPAWQPRTIAPDPDDIIETATFMDGLGRVVQVKKDASEFDPATQTNTRVREVSGLTTYNWMGLQTQSLMSQLEPTSVDIRQFNLVPFTDPSATEIRVAYDLMNRVYKQYGNTFNQYAAYEVTTDYFWSDDWHDDWYFVQDVIDNEHVSAKTHAQKYFDSRSQVALTKTIDDAGPEPDIVTQFSYDLLGQMVNTTDPIGKVTSYEYDWFGRAWRENHPDRGTTSSTFDKAGNVTGITTANATVTLDYYYNRLISKTYPTTAAINNLSYTYGSLGDGKNGAGRVTEVLQGNNVVQEKYTYDELGNVATENKTIAIPLVGEMRFITQYQFDSWGRIKEIQYPDDERVAYTYLPAGELLSVQRVTTNGPVVDYVTSMGYDGFGNQKYMLYGNRVETVKDYNANNRSLKSVDINAITHIQATNYLHKSIAYFNNGNIRGISNTTPAVQTGFSSLGGDYENAYTYDYANRLVQSTHFINFHDQEGPGRFEYTLDLTYNPAGGIETKKQAEAINGAGYSNAMEYYLDYLYQNNDNDHKLNSLSMDYKGQNYGMEYVYDPRGNVTGIGEHPELGYQTFIWDEADRLRAVQNNAGLHHYVYDGTGTRILKGSLLQNSTQQNGEGGSNGYTLTPYTVYPNAYTVCTFYREHVDITNHYYAGAQRVASKLYQSAYKLDFSTTVDEGPRDPEGPEAGTGGNNTPTSFIYHQPTPNNVVLTDGLDAIIQDILPAQQFATPVSISMNDLIALGLPGRLPADLGAYPPCEEGSFDPYQIPQDWQLGYFDCLCNYYPQLAEDFNINCQLYSSIYWYHPDYLGNTEFVTDAGGYPYQFFYYSAFGESLVQQNANTGSFATPYRFNAKELDPETGNYYYGARYYNPQTSIWFGVDAMSSERAWLSPYQFVQNNPVALIDPDGNLDDVPETSSSNYVTQQKGSIDNNISAQNAYCPTCPNTPEFQHARDSKFLWNYNPTTKKAEIDMSSIILIGSTAVEISSEILLNTGEIKSNFLYSQGWRRGINGNYRLIGRNLSQFGNTPMTLGSKPFNNYTRFGLQLSKAGYVLSVANVAIDTYQVSTGMISIQRYSYRLAGSLTAIYIGAQYGGIYGAAAATTWVAGEMFYDLMRDWGTQTANFVVQFENAIKYRGWYPR